MLAYSTTSPISQEFCWHAWMRPYIVIHSLIHSSGLCGLSGLSARPCMVIWIPVSCASMALSVVGEVRPAGSLLHRAWHLHPRGQPDHNGDYPHAPCPMHSTLQCPFDCCAALLVCIWYGTSQPAASHLHVYGPGYRMPARAHYCRVGKSHLHTGRTRW